MSDEPVTKQIEGVCEEISEKNGWTTFAINVGSQYPVRLSTKLPALIEQGRAVGDQYAVWTFKETQGGENPNKPGTYYTNRYFDSVEVGGTVQAGASPGAPSRNASMPDDVKQHLIVRQACLKVAATVLAASYADVPDGTDVANMVIANAARFETWVYRDIDSPPFE